MSSPKTLSRESMDATDTQGNIVGLFIHAGKPLPVKQYTVKRTGTDADHHRINLLLGQHMAAPFFSKYISYHDVLVLHDQILHLRRPVISLLQYTVDTGTGVQEIAIKYW